MEYSTIISSFSALIIVVAAVLAGLYFTGFFTPNVDCVVSDWSTCDPATSLQTRTVTTAASGKGQACPALTQSCTPNVDCVVSDWSACNPTTSLQTRTVTTPVSGQGKACPALTQSCTPNIDCVVSDWSTCDPTSKTKSRTITTPSSGSGKACPTVLQSDCIPDGNYFLVNDAGGVNGNFVCSDTLDSSGALKCDGWSVDVVSITNTSDGNLALKGTKGYYGISGNNIVNNLTTLQPFNIKYTDKTQGTFNLFDGSNTFGLAPIAGKAVIQVLPNTADLTNTVNQWVARKAS